MYRRHGQKIAALFVTCDLAVTALVWVGAYFLRFQIWASPNGVPQFTAVLRALPIVLVLAVLAYRSAGLYQVHRLQRLPRELGAICQAGGLLFLLVITAAFYRRDLYESRLALTLFLVLNVVTIAAVRRTIWALLVHLRERGLNHGRAVIVGAGRTGRLLARTMRNNRWTGLDAVGFVDVPAKVEPAALPRLGTIRELPQIVARHDIDHVFIALPLQRYGELPEVYRILSDLLVEVQLVPDIPAVAGMRVRTVEVDQVPFLSLRANPHFGWHRLVKRATDLVVGTLALIALAPVMITLAVLIKLTSRGPIFYSQPRGGLGARDFRMIKFRSMRVDAEQSTGPVWASRDDDRCTALGRFMRRHSLDELPQLFNVLKGDMSLVGPRPERGVFIEKFRKQIPNYCQRHQVKAGMTGWAQVNGWRGNTSLRKRLEFDLYYIANWSLWLDLKILFLTLFRGFRHPNAH
ncbi:MAG: undecaprenyl-phosphate glucose phosphotransferase [Planctomycetaceae bacterium]|nr:undecaprenyl-phosphate glucose phosphotransferase [Planctomycetaceae bacterium]